MDNASSASPELTGQVAIVTGAGRGIGRAIAITLAGAGASVALFARTESELEQTAARITQASGKTAAFSVDVTDAAKVSAAIQQVEKSMGPVELLVNNAGASGPIGPFGQTDLNAWWNALEVNLHGTVLCSHFVLEHMLPRRRGRIVNITSGAGAAPLAYFSSYATSKTAIVRLTECIAAETHLHGITAFSVAPGTVRTAMSEYSLNSPEGKKWMPWFQRVFDEGLDVPPEWPAQLVLALASGKADILSGRFLSILDDLNLMLKNSADIEKNNLYSLRMQKLPSDSVDPKLASIRAAAEQGTQIKSIHIERTFSATRERAFLTWIDPLAVAQWFIPLDRASWIRPPQIDAKPGGRFSWNATSQGKSYHLYGTYLQVQKHNKLQFQWQWDHPMLPGTGDTVVTVEFFDAPQETTVVLTHQNFVSEEAREAHEKGWQRCLDSIAAYLAAPSVSK